jgi:hypothetical protein
MFSFVAGHRFDISKERSEVEIMVSCQEEKATLLARELWPAQDRALPQLGLRGHDPDSCVQSTVFTRGSDEPSRF